MAASLALLPPRQRVRLLGLPLKVAPLTARRLGNFRANRRGYVSAGIFLVLFALSLCAEVIANDKPVFIWFDGQPYFPAFVAYAETDFGGDFPTEADYRDPYLQGLIDEKGYAVWPPIPFSYGTVITDLGKPAPSAPDARNWLGTDDQARDVLARVIYGFRLSVVFGLVLTILSSIMGVAAGAVQGYFGGWTDLGMQRFIEIWSSVPTLFLLIILGSILEPGFMTLLILMLLFSWMGLVDVVRAEFLRARNLDFVRAARALGAGDAVIMFKHILPNAMVATLSFMPFILSSSIGSLTSLDFLGFGLPTGSPSLGELALQGKNNPQAPWLGLSAFFVLTIMLSLLVFVGEAIRDAFDPRKTFR